MLTYDDGNLIKLWNIVDMVCYQTVHIHTYTPIQAIVCLHERLIVGVYRLGDYEFTHHTPPEKRIVEALTYHDERLYVAVSGTIRCINIRTGKTDQIL